VVGTDPAAVGEALAEVWSAPPKAQPIEGWDGRAGERVAADLLGS